MNGFEITELGQVREQENMLQRAESQARRRARRAAGVPRGSGLGRLIAWRRPFVVRLGSTRTAAAPHRGPAKPTPECI
jgi:hypothetical protein